MDRCTAWYNLGKPFGRQYVVKRTTISTVSSLAAAMRYRDVAMASEWLCAAFGFQKHLVVTGETGAVNYAQLIFGNAMLMLAPVRDFALDKYMKQPDEIGGAETQSCYLIVSDADAHYARAKASGAEIIVGIQDDDLGGRCYSCRDLEGHIWNFGTYDPWEGNRPGCLHAQPTGNFSRGAKRCAVVVGFLATIVASAVAGAAIYGALTEPEMVSLATRAAPAQPTFEAVAKEDQEQATRGVQERLSAEQRAREAAEHAVQEAREQLGRERIAKETAERTVEHASKGVEDERRAREAAENSLRDTRQEFDRVRSAKEADGSERAAGEMREQLDRERASREIADRNAKHATQRAIEEQIAREAAELFTREMREQLARESAAKETAERNSEQSRQRASEQQSAREAAERVAKEAREQLIREQSAKNAAWKTAAQLRRQLSQMQSAQEPAAESSTDAEGQAPEPKTSPTRAKLKQKAKLKSQQE